jgi:mannitol-1-phosphate/altronate dehydrogenase
MLEINQDELRVLACLIHAEWVEAVITETGLQEMVVIDIVKHLRHYRYVKPVDDSGREIAMFEADKIRKVKFILTSKGYSVLESQNPNIIS